jgi:toxin ParE1/3/4
MANFRISKKAVVDLDGIWAYTLRNWSEEQADKYYNLLRGTIIKLAEIQDFPGRQYDFVRPNLWGFHVGHHVIFYKKQRNGLIFIVRILHEKMDYPRHF